MSLNRKSRIEHLRTFAFGSLRRKIAALVGISDDSPLIVIMGPGGRDVRGYTVRPSRGTSLRLNGNLSTKIEPTEAVKLVMSSKADGDHGDHNRAQLDKSIPQSVLIISFMM